MRAKRAILRTGAEVSGSAAVQKANQRKQMGGEAHQPGQASDFALPDRIAKLERLTFADWSNFLTVNACGSLEIDLSKCSPDGMVFFAQLTMGVRKLPGAYAEVHVSSGFKMKNRLKALDALGTYLGMGKKGTQSRRKAVPRCCNASRAHRISRALPCLCGHIGIGNGDATPLNGIARIARGGIRGPFVAGTGAFGIGGGFGPT